MRFLLQSTLYVAAGSLGLVLASNSAQALTVQATVNGITYDVTTFTGTYNGNASKFNTISNNGLMPWWGSESLARDFATQVWDALGINNLGFAGPLFAYTTIPDYEDPSLIFARGYLYNSTIPGISGAGPTLTEPFTYSITTPAAPPAAAPGPLPIFGAAAAFGMSRRLRRRIQLGG